MADNTGKIKKESPLPEETVSEVQASLEQQSIPEQSQESIEISETEAQPGIPENEVEQKEEQAQDDQRSVDEPAVTPTSTPSSSTQVEEDLLTQQINSILEEDMVDLFLSMPPDKQFEFKKKGEETSSKIRQLVSSTKVNAKKVFHLIRAWLKIIPGVNRFFLEQEAKLKTDKILLASEEEKKRQQEL